MILILTKSDLLECYKEKYIELINLSLFPSCMLGAIEHSDIVIYRSKHLVKILKNRLTQAPPYVTTFLEFNKLTMGERYDSNL